MSYRRTEIVVGTFLLLGVLLMLWGIFKTGGFALGTTRSHYSSYENVNTIETGSPVKYGGMLVGRVSSIRVDPETPTLIRIDYEISADEGIVITERMEAKITKSDLLSEEYIDIRIAGAARGSSEAMQAEGRVLAPGSAIPAGEPFDLQRALEDLQATIGSIDIFLATAQTAVDEASAEILSILADAHLLVSEQNRNNVASALEDVAATTSQLRSMLSENRERIATIVGSVASATDNLDSASFGIKETVDDLRPDIEELADKLQAAVTQLQEAAASASGTLDAIDVEQVNEIVGNIDTVSRNLVEFTDEIKQRPYRLIRKGTPPPKEFK